MKKAGSAEEDLGMPAADELWPGGMPSAADVDVTGTRENEGRTTPVDEMWRFATPRPAAAVMPAPPTFPVAPPIRPLSLPDTHSFTAVIETQPAPAVVETTQPDAVRMENPLPAETPRAAVESEIPSLSPPLTASYRARGPHVGSTLGPDALEQMLRAAAARGASTVYVRAGTESSMRVHGELQILEGTPVLGPAEIEMLLVSLKLAHHTDVRGLFASSEWSFDLADVGHIRCATFKDHRGAGATFQIVPYRVAAKDQIGLSLDVQRLASEREGLVIVSGPRASGKLRLMHQLAHLITRGRRAYVVAVQRSAGIPAAHEPTSISQREVRDGLDDMLAVARAALREHPDVLVLHHARSAPLMSLALEAAASGQLVIAGITAPTALGALERILELYPSEQARSVQRQLAQYVRGIVGQVLVPKARGGGIIAAQEVMVMTPAIAAVLAEGQAWQLRAALEAAPTRGMVPLSDGLANLVRTGEVRPEDAYRRAPDPAALLERFERYGIDTSFAHA